MSPWLIFVFIVSAAALRSTHHNPKLPHRPISKRYEGSSDLVNLTYHMGPVLSSAMDIYLIWYGDWKPPNQAAIKDFLASISSPPGSTPFPSVSDWWKTVTLYTDQTGSNVSRTVTLAGELVNRYSRGKILSRLSIQYVILDSLRSPPPHVGLFLVLTSDDVIVQDFCRAVCGFHYFTFPSIVGSTLPYAWVGNSARQCPEVCNYPFTIPLYIPGSALSPPNPLRGIDGMISVIGHELAEVSSNPLVNAWYAGDDPVAPTEIADLCEGVYGSGGGGGFIGQVMKDPNGKSFNLNGLKKRMFLVQWIWNPVINACSGPNAIV